MRKVSTVLATVFTMSLGLVGGGTISMGVAAAAPSCVAAGTSGLTAAVVATPGQTISNQTINAAGCDVGIFVGQGAAGVTIDAVTVTGAADQGILAQDTSGLTVSNSSIHGNGFMARVSQSFGISLFGVSGSTVTGNTVTDNGAGGIGLMDDGPFDPGTPLPGPSVLVPSTNDTIANNHTSANYAGCGIVLAVQNPGGSLSNVTVTGNIVTGTHSFGRTGPDVGGIVVAADAPGTAINTALVSHNTVTNSFEGGIIVHAEAPHAHTVGVSVTGNTLSGNNWGLTNGPTALVGVIVSDGPAPAPIRAFNSGTVVSGNTITNEFYGIWSDGPSVPTVSGNSITVNAGGTPFYIVPAPGSGYWEVASDGGIFNFGSAGFYGSMGGTVLNKPVVGVAATEDQGGYWEVASDGGIFSFGDAQFQGSMGGTPLNKPVVGIAATPYVPGIAGAPATPGGLGYWEVASDGGIFNFGDAKFYGSMGAKVLNKPVVGIAATPDGRGYWEVASDGGVFSFGDAKFYGSMGGSVLNKPVVAIVSTPDGHGYWEMASDGGVFSFGDAKFYGSMGGTVLNKPVVGATGVGMTYSG